MINNMEYKYPEEHGEPGKVLFSGIGTLDFSVIASMDTTKNILTLGDIKIQVTEEQSKELVAFFHDYEITPRPN